MFQGSKGLPVARHSEQIRIISPAQRCDPPLCSSYWMEEAGGLPPPANRLSGGRYDHVVIGGGFVGLWTALHVRQLQPDARIAVIERYRCGSGASGRNGGSVMSWWSEIGALLAIADAAEAVRLAQASQEAIESIEQFCLEHGIDAHFTRGGWLWTATLDPHRDSWAEVLKHCERLGHMPFDVLRPQDVAVRTGSPVHLHGILEPGAVTVQPARLVIGMRRVALEQGIQIFEETPVTHIETGDPVRVHTDDGTVTAQSVVLATNAWAAAIPALSRLIVPVNSSIVVTEPVRDVLHGSGWRGDEAINDSQTMVNYYRKTRDGRLAFGKGTGALARGSHIDATFSAHEPSLRLTEADLRHTYPQLASARVTHRWSGPIDRTYDNLPVLGTVPGTGNVHYGIGWSGHGVAPSYLGGRILARLALNIRDEWSECALVNRVARRFPVEPFRSVGGNVIRNAVLRKERAAREGRAVSWVDMMLAKLAPGGH